MKIFKEPLITDELVHSLFHKYEIDEDGVSGRDTWSIATDVIDELINNGFIRSAESNRISHYYHIHAIYETIQKYIVNTYVK